MTTSQEIRKCIQKRKAELRAEGKDQSDDVVLKKLESMRRLYEGVIPYIGALQGKEVEFESIEDQRGSAADILEYSGVDGFIKFKSLDTRYGYASRTWSQRSIDPHCGGALLRFTKRAGTWIGDPRAQKGHPGSENDPRNCRVFLEVSKLMFDYMATEGGVFQPTFGSNYHIFSYFRADGKKGAGKCLRFSLVRTDELAAALQEILGRIWVGERTLLDVIAGMYNARIDGPYRGKKGGDIISSSDFSRVRSAIVATGSLNMVGLKSRDGVEFLYIPRKILEGTCPSLEFWEDGWKKLTTGRLGRQRDVDFIRVSPAIKVIPTKVMPTVDIARPGQISPVLLDPRSILPLPLMGVSEDVGEEWTPMDGLTAIPSTQWTGPVVVTVPAAPVPIFPRRWVAPVLVAALAGAALSLATVIVGRVSREYAPKINLRTNLTTPAPAPRPAQSRAVIDFRSLSPAGLPVKVPSAVGTADSPARVSASAPHENNLSKAAAPPDSKLPDQTSMRGYSEAAQHGHGEVRNAGAVTPIVTPTTRPAIVAAARRAFASHDTERWQVGTVYGYATVVIAGVFDGRGCPRFRVTRNDQHAVQMGEWAFCEALPQ